MWIDSALAVIRASPIELRRRTVKRVPCQSRRTVPLRSCWSARSSPACALIAAGLASATPRLAQRASVLLLHVLHRRSRLAKQARVHVDAPLPPLNLHASLAYGASDRVDISRCALQFPARPLPPTPPIREGSIKRRCQFSLDLHFHLVASYESGAPRGNHEPFDTSREAQCSDGLYGMHAVSWTSLPGFTLCWAGGF